MEFVHLHVHSEYSLRQGALRLQRLVERTAALGMEAVAVTDSHGLYGAVTFYRLARAAGVRPILGAQLCVALDAAAGTAAEATRSSQGDLDCAVLLAQTLAGYENLVRLVTLAHRRGPVPFVTFAELAEHSSGLAALVGGGESLPMRWWAAGQGERAEAWLRHWQEVWPAGQLYVDLQDHGLPEERRGLPSLLQWAQRAGLPLVASNDVHYDRPEDADVQRVLAQIEGGPQARVLSGHRYDLAAPAEMARRLAAWPEALRNAVALADACRVELPLGQLRLPRYPCPDGESAAVVLRRAAWAGARQRYGGELSAAVQERLQYELDVIEQLGFADYFLVVADFIRYAHRQGIATGPGRGSAAGSLVAYALRITDVDPLRHQLLFERFLNPERVSWPDIDTDFEYERRGEVIHYVVQRYGAERVAQIGTFGTLAARAAIRDAGRVLQADAALIDRIAKWIPSQPGVTLATARAQVPALAELLEQPAAARLWAVAEAIEGFPRHTSVHAAGVVIAPEPLASLVPVQPGADGTPVTQYAMEDVEALGFMKMDFLGLRTLTLIDKCTGSVEERCGVRIDWRQVPEDDPATYAMLGRGETEGCFQLESAGVRRVLRELKPTRLEDLIAVISLYRPGPMEQIPDFMDARHGRRPVQYPHPDLEPILRDTYGVLVYQEQIMQIAAQMAGFTLGQADLLRRAVGKKQRELLDQERDRFVAGCVRNGYDEALAHRIYDLIVRFADYGFNRSHAAAYAVLAFRTAYLRAHYPADFLAALMTMALGDASKLHEYKRAAQQLGIQVLPPDVNCSHAAFVVESDQTIRTGLLAVRHVGRGAVEAILAARSERPFSSLVDFLQRVNSRACNRKAVESLLQAGALAAFLPGQVQPPAALQMLEQAYLEAEAGKERLGLGLDWESTTAETVLYIRCDPQAGPPGLWQAVRAELARHPGVVRVALYSPRRRRVRLLEPRWSVTVSPELIAALEEWVGLGNARLGRLRIPPDAEGPRGRRPRQGD